MSCFFNPRVYLLKAREMDKRKTAREKIAFTIKNIQALSEDILEYRSIDTPTAYQKVNKRIRSRRSGIQTFRTVVTRAAAILLLPLLLSSAVLLHLYRGQQEELRFISYQSVESAPGTVTWFMLPDSSKVWLNGGSKLEYPSRFSGGMREVALSGEAYFEVSSDKTHPFYVNAGCGVKIMAYGTRFNVMAYEDESYVEAVLEKGKIDMIIPGKSVSLHPAEQVLFDRGTGEMTVSPINLEEKTAWREGRLVFRNAPLQEVLRRLSKRYNVRIVLHQESNRVYRYRATFTTEDISRILNYLQLTAPLSWTITDMRQRKDSSFAGQQIDVYVR